jgi:hypothetical protein
MNLYTIKYRLKHRDDPIFSVVTQDEIFHRTRLAEFFDLCFGINRKSWSSSRLETEHQAMGVFLRGGWKFSILDECYHKGAFDADYIVERIGE